MWANSSDVKRTFSSANIVKGQKGRWIFDISGNNHRLVAAVDIEMGSVMVQKVMTHGEYDAWNRNGRP